MPIRAISVCHTLNGLLELRARRLLRAGGCVADALPPRLIQQHDRSHVARWLRAVSSRVLVLSRRNLANSVLCGHVHQRVERHTLLELRSWSLCDNRGQHGMRVLRQGRLLRGSRRKQRIGLSALRGRTLVGHRRRQQQLDVDRPAVARAAAQRAQPQQPRRAPRRAWKSGWFIPSLVFMSR